MANFTPLFNVSEQVHYNVSYIIANQPVNMTTQAIFIVVGLLGIGFLVLSILNIDPVCNDLAGVIAIPFLLLNTIQAFAVDTVTGYGVTNTGNEWVLMENHTIYHYDLLGVIFGILFIIALANMYRLWLDSKRVTDQPRPTVGSEDTGRSVRSSGKKQDEDRE